MVLQSVARNFPNDMRSRKVEAGKVVVRHVMFVSFAFDVLFILLLITNEDYL